MLQISLRVGACAALGDCIWSLAKGLIWSAVWPAWLIATGFPITGLILVNCVLGLLIFVIRVPRQSGQHHGISGAPDDLPGAHVGWAVVFDSWAGRPWANMTRVLGRTKKYWLLPVVATTIIVVMALSTE
ncbi:MAG: hypothetical protein HQ511_03410 [Rhodospirillales bacterium]|nr:hypothetical protein [Rhodospirillales bacterium]